MSSKHLAETSTHHALSLANMMLASNTVQPSNPLVACHSNSMVPYDRSNTSYPWVATNILETALDLCTSAFYQHTNTT